MAPTRVLVLVLARLLLAASVAEAPCTAAGSCGVLAEDGDAEAMKVSMLQLRGLGSQEASVATAATEVRRAELLLELAAVEAELLEDEQEEDALAAFAHGGEAPRNLVVTESGCYDVKEGDGGMCMSQITWSRKEGLLLHPEWYPGLSNGSSLEAWQMHGYTHGKCPKPCSLLGKPQPLCEDVEGSALELWAPRAVNMTVEVKVLSYNLFWWNLYGIHKGNHGSAGKVIASGMNPAFDVMGFQECEDPAQVLADAGLEIDYEAFPGTHAICMAYRKATWRLLARGEGEVAVDQVTEYYGQRGTQWMRLAHQTSGATLLFMNHHGPLSVNSGGECGGRSTANNLVKLMKKVGVPGDIIVLVGDFNANAVSKTIQQLWQHLVLAYNGNSFGGVDNVFTNVPRSGVHSTRNLGSGGSDHEAIQATMELKAMPHKGAARKEAGSCAKFGCSNTFQYNHACQCNADCAKHNSCCADHQSACAGQAVATPAPSPGPSIGPYYHGPAAKEPQKAISDAVTSECGLYESNTEYTFKGQMWEQKVDGVTSPRTCCNMCNKQSWHCKAYVWEEYVVAVAGPRCTLKGGLPIERPAKDGFVSGLAVRVAQRDAQIAGAKSISHM